MSQTKSYYDVCTRTHEPIRPIYGEWNITESYTTLWGETRVFYGWSYWPSYSYRQFTWNEDVS